MFHHLMFPHQTGFSLSPIENAVPAHNYSSSEGSDIFPFGASASGDAFVRAGSADSAIGSLAANDEPYLPARRQSQPTVHPSPLSYSVAPEFVSGHADHSPSPGHTQTDPTYDAYGSQYRQQPSYGSDDMYEYAQDGPYIPPNFYHPPPLAVQSQRHFGYQQQRMQQLSIPPSHAVPHPLIAPQIQRDLPDSPLSSSSDGSLVQDFGHQAISSMPPSPPQAHSPSDVVSQRMSEPIQVPLPGDDQEAEGTHPEPPADDGNDSDGSVHSQHWVETDRYLRNQIGIPEGTRVDLWALPDPPSGQKPQQPLPILVKLAIHGCTRGMLTLQEIYQALEDRFEYFARLKSSAWKNSIRHNLSLNQVFRSCDRPITEPGKGRYWSLDISKGEGYKRERRRKRRNAAPYNGTRDLPGGIGNRLNPEDLSSDPEQEMVDDPPTAGRAPTVKTSKRGRKRGPYTRITIGQPSIPGSTGITAGGAAAAALVNAHVGGSNSPASGAPSPAAHAGTPAAPSPVGIVGSGSMTYAATAAAASAGTSSHTGASSTVPASLAPPASHLQQQQENEQMRGAQSAAPVTLPYPFPSSYHGMYFNRAPVPTFGQTSLGATGTFVPQTRVGFLNPVGSATARGHGRDGSAISISSDEMSSPELRERMLGNGAGGRMSG